MINRKEKEVQTVLEVVIAEPDPLEEADEDDDDDNKGKSIKLNDNVVIVHDFNVSPINHFGQGTVYIDNIAFEK